jgi:UDP-N-acetyl-L-fucosamine synthase
VKSDAIVDAIDIVLDQFETDGPPVIPVDYQISDTSRRAVNFIRSTAHTHHQRTGIFVNINR